METLKLFFGQVCEGCIAIDLHIGLVDSKICFSIPSASSWVLVSMLRPCLFISPSSHKLFNNSMTKSVQSLWRP